jgi:hypothetical protein
MSSKSNTVSLKAMGVIGRAPRRIIHDECAVDGEIVLGLYLRGPDVEPRTCERCRHAIREGGVVVQAPASTWNRDRLGAHH